MKTFFHSCFILWSIAILNSCHTKLKQSYMPCTFDAEQLIVFGNDKYIKDTIKSPTGYCLYDIIRMNAMPAISCDNRYRSNFPKHIQAAPNLTYKIYNCRDTTWAKAQIHKEIKRRYPYEVFDSIEHMRLFDVFVVDSTKLKKANPNVMSRMSWNGKIVYYIGMTSPRLYTVINQVISAIDNKNGIESSSDKRYISDILAGQYDYKVDHHFTNHATYESFRKYLLDSVGFDFRITLDTIIPVTWVKFKEIE